MIQPLGKRVLILPIKEDATVKSTGLSEIDEDFLAPQSIKGEVVVIGTSVTLVSIGQIVLCSQFAPTQTKEKPGDKYVTLPEEDILAVIVPDKLAS